MWFKTLLSFMFMALVGCASVGPGKTLLEGAKPPNPPTIVMHGDKNFTADERKAFERVSDTWSRQTDGLAKISFVWDLDPSDTKAMADIPLIWRLNSESEEVKAEDCDVSERMGLPPGLCLPVVLAWVSPVGGIHSPEENVPVQMVAIPDRYASMDEMYATILHEAGHVFGLPHLPQYKSAVMYPAEHGQMCLTQPDLSEFCKANDCTGHTMHPCEH